jgi:hypothetical protein
LASMMSALGLGRVKTLCRDGLGRDGLRFKLAFRL